MEVSASLKMEDANGVVDWDVDIVGPDGGAACKQLVETEDHDATECSSSFGVTLSGSEDDTKPSEISDIEVDSPFFHYPSNGDAAALMDAAVSDNTDRLLKKKRVTDHWRKFISPLMWRCQWRTMKRRKRKRSEEKMNVSSYISNHTVFSYYEKMEAEAHSIDDDENTADDSTPANNDTDSLLGIKRDDATIKQIVLSIQSVQDKVLSLRSSLNKAMAKTSKGATLKVNTHINSAQSSSCSLGKGKASEILERSPRDTSDCDIDEAAVPESALSSYGEDDDMDIFESTMNLLSAEDPHQMGEYHQGSEDVLIDNQAAEEGYQNFEVITHPCKRLKISVKGETGTHSEDESIAPAVDAKKEAAHQERPTSRFRLQGAFFKPYYTGKRKGRRPMIPRRGGGGGGSSSATLSSWRRAAAAARCASGCSRTPRLGRRRAPRLVRRRARSGLALQPHAAPRTPSRAAPRAPPRALGPRARASGRRLALSHPRRATRSAVSLRRLRGGRFAAAPFGPIFFADLGRN
ncbi:hypothetical protein GUJ93_ZPchr0005g15186 [Zizania palustris]|uniref:Uncharacterized protein n=1 Tax=Zizania palustris TaxID=103762 RepID=A0A8J5W0J6_ZIZPA|nr:hypothetical protein GUJ93_ZPchr0005g15186 [Zizania palustris]